MKQKKQNNNVQHTNFTTMYHIPRIQLGLSVLDYCVAETIYTLSNNPSARYIGWCYMGKDNMADSLNVGIATIHRCLKLLKEKGLIEQHPTAKSSWRTTQLWYDNVILYHNSPELYNIDKKPKSNQNDRSKRPIKMIGETNQNDCLDQSKRLDAPIKMIHNRDIEDINRDSNRDIASPTVNNKTNTNADISIYTEASIPTGDNIQNDDRLNRVKKKLKELENLVVPQKQTIADCISIWNEHTELKPVNLNMFYHTEGCKRLTELLKTNTFNMNDLIRAVNSANDFEEDKFKYTLKGALKNYNDIISFNEIDDRPLDNNDTVIKQIDDVVLQFV